MLDGLRRASVPMLAFALGFMAALPVDPARADDAYVCDGGRLVYANSETLEKLKQTDPCIAGYYAQNPLRTERPQPAPVVIEEAPARPRAPLAPAPKSKPQSLQRDAGLKGTTTATVSARTPKARAAPLAPPLAAAGTDFRNVRVINAPAGSPAVYHHER